jgi:hypothetical protein
VALTPEGLPLGVLRSVAEAPEAKGVTAHIVSVQSSHSNAQLISHIQ